MYFTCVTRVGYDNEFWWTHKNKAQKTKAFATCIEKPKKAPLKADLIFQFKVLEKEHEALKLENIKKI